MTQQRWNYRGVEVKPGLFGLKSQALQDELNRLGAQGWELVSLHQTDALHPARLTLKRPT